MIYAQVKDNKIVNVIVLDDPSISSLFLTGFDYLVEITLDPGNPAIGWTYNPDTQVFTPPQEDDNG